MLSLTRGLHLADNAQTEFRSPRGVSLWEDGLRRLCRRRLAVVCFGVIVAYFLLAVFIYIAEFFNWHIGPTSWATPTGPSYQPPCAQNILGTDIFGLSVFRKMLYGAKISITVAFSASLISIAIGLPLGAIAGYFRGFVDEIIVWAYSTLSSVPYILLIMAFAVVLHDRTIAGFKLSGITSVYLAIGLTSWVDLCRLIRGETIKHKEREYILAAQSYGCTNSRVIFKHLLPNVFHIVIIIFSLQFVSFIHAEIILSFLGLGEADRPSWGAMINDARIELARGVWWQMVAATVAVFIISLALNVFGDALRDSLDPKLRVR